MTGSYNDLWVFKPFHESSDNEWKLGLLIGIPASIFILALIAIIFVLRRRENRKQEMEMEQKGKLNDIPVIEDVVIGEKIGRGQLFSFFFKITLPFCSGHFGDVWKGDCTSLFLQGLFVE